MSTGTHKVTVYGQPRCGPCSQLKADLMVKDIPFEYADISTDADARQAVVDAGFRSVPVVQIDDAFYPPDAAKVLLKCR